MLESRESIGDRIKKLRKEKGLTMHEFGKTLGMSKSSISGIEAGKNGPSEQTVRLICSVYSVEYFWLKTGDGNMYRNETDILIEDLVKEQNLDSDTARMLRRFLGLSKESKKVVLKVVLSAIVALLDEEEKI